MYKYVQSTTTQNGLHITSHPNPNYYYTTTTIAAKQSAATPGSAGPATVSSSADLVLGGLRHHRDLFTGSLGIPDVNTHVGSVIHAFESLAHQRAINDSQLISDSMSTSPHTAEQPYELSADGIASSHNYGRSLSKKNISTTTTRKQSENRHKSELAAATMTASEAGRNTMPQYHHQPQQHSGVVGSFATQQHHHYLHHQYPSVTTAGGSDGATAAAHIQTIGNGYVPKRVDSRYRACKTQFREIFG